MQLFNLIALPALLLASQAVAQNYGAPAPAPSSDSPAASSPSAAAASPSAQAASASSGALGFAQLPMEATVGALILTGSVIALM